jgi:signal transduction histidine kinase
LILTELAAAGSAQHGVFYTMTTRGRREPVLEFQAGYGYEERKQLATSFRSARASSAVRQGEERILLTERARRLRPINSGSSAPAAHIIVLPCSSRGRSAVSSSRLLAFSATHQAFLDQLPESIGLVLSTIEANTLTENALQQSQALASELRSQQEELRESNEDLGRQAKLLAEQNILAEAKNQEVEESKRQVEEKAGQLSLSSQYKSEFIANMSHELRTPAQQLLMLAQLLEENP